jgi:peptide/nickel transport system substrate-binding protein
MKRSGWQWLAASSLLIGAIAAGGETRPRYGGTLRIEMSAAPASLDPAEGNVPDSFGRRNITALIFDTLVKFDDAARPEPVLADSWQAAGQELRLHLRRDVKFHDGSAMTPESVAASLRLENPAWKVTAEPESVSIQNDLAEDGLLAELALPRNAIVKRDSGKLNGTGPFRIVDWKAGERLSLAADENCWRGRPFLDAIEIEMGKSYRDQMTALQLGRSDLVEIAAGQVRHTDQRSMASSKPIELIALWFAKGPSSPEENALRSALSLSVDRTAIRDVLLQGTGETAGSILPNWMSGYGFVFSAKADLVRARQLRGQISPAPSWKIGYSPDDPLDRLLAERIALNARDAGLFLQTTSTPSADLRIAHLPLESGPWSSLGQIADQIGAPLAKEHGSLAELYAAERTVLATGRIIPLLHLPVSYAAFAGLQNWAVRPDATLNLENAWMESGGQ